MLSHSAGKPPPICAGSRTPDQCPAQGKVIEFSDYFRDLAKEREREREKKKRKKKGKKERQKETETVTAMRMDTYA